MLVKDGKPMQVTLLLMLMLVEVGEEEILLL
jgi:hypothetical protein